MIKGYCRTNLDGYERVQWPEEFVAVPRVGERVRGRLSVHEYRDLKVIEVTHLTNVDRLMGESGACIEVELHK